MFLKHHIHLKFFSNFRADHFSRFKPFLFYYSFSCCPFYTYYPVFNNDISIFLHQQSDSKLARSKNDQLLDLFFSRREVTKKVCVPHHLNKSETFVQRILKNRLPRDNVLGFIPILHPTIYFGYTAVPDPYEFCSPSVLPELLGIWSFLACTTGPVSSWFPRCRSGRTKQKDPL